MKILVLALGRSGHHAVLNWIIKQFEGSTIHYNNCELGWEDGQLIPARDRVLIYDNGEVVSDPNGIGGLTRSSPSREFKNQAYSIESFDMDDYVNFNFDDLDFDKVILVVRDFYNWVASTIASESYNPPEDGMLTRKWKDCRGREREPTKGLWIKQAKELEGVTNLIKSPKVLISYDHWFSQEDYRKTICEEIGINYSKKGLQEIPDFGGGSSFSFFHIDGNAQKMDVLNRWKAIPLEDFEKIYSEEVDEINEDIYNLSMDKIRSHSKHLNLLSEYSNSQKNWGQIHP